MAKGVSYDELIKMAESYGVADNALFLSAARQYEIQMKVIHQIEAVLDSTDPVVTKSYVKEVENAYSHPMIKELPKHADSANKTLNMMLDIIVKLGHKSEGEDELSKMGKA